MSKLFRIATLIMLSILLVVGIFFMKPALDNRSQEAGHSKASADYEGNGSGAEHSAPADSGEQDEAVSSEISMVDEEGKSSPVEEVLNFELSVIEGANQMALGGRWSYDEKVKNIALWEGLCLAPDEKISTLVEAAGESEELHANVEKLCEGFPSAVSEVDDFLEVEIDERMRGTNERADLETSLEDLGPDSATVVAISELSRALESLDYARTLEVVWFLGTYNFNGASEEFTVYRRQPKVETMVAVSASIFCNYIGGCRDSHPVALNLCFQFPDRPCSNRPVDIYDAVEQVLTGYELETFNQMNSSLVRLLNRYRRGDL